MDKHYKEALVNAAVEKLREEQDTDVLKEDVAVIVESCPLLGDWNKDLNTLINACAEQLSEVDDEDEEPENLPCASPLACIAERKEKVETKIEEILATLKIGHNFIPGIGVGYCKDEKDLEEMRTFVRGALTVQAMGCYLSE